MSKKHALYRTVGVTSTELFVVRIGFDGGLNQRQFCQISGVRQFRGPPAVGCRHLFLAWSIISLWPRFTARGWQLAAGRWQLAW